MLREHSTVAAMIFEFPQSSIEKTVKYAFRPHTVLVPLAYLFRTQLRNTTARTAASFVWLPAQKWPTFGHASSGPDMAPVKPGPSVHFRCSVACDPLHSTA